MTEKSAFEKLEDALSEHLLLISVIVIFTLVCVLFYYLDWWDAIGLMVLNLGLGVKLHGAKTFAMAVAKSGGKKALAMTTVGVLIKRHVIDLMSKFFAEHSIKRWKKNVGKIAKLKFDNMMASTPIQKAKAIGGTVLSIPFLYFIWTKVLGTAIQKFIYALIYPLFIWLFDFIAHGFSFITSFISFIFQLTFLNYLITWMEKKTLGKAIIKWVTYIFSLLGDTFEFLNKAFKVVGLDPKHRLIVWSNKFNRWLESILQKEMNARDTLASRRELHYTSREVLIMHRMARGNQEKVSMKKKFRKFYDKKVLKKQDWREKRETLEKDRKKKFERKNIKRLPKTSRHIKKATRISGQSFTNVLDACDYTRTKKNIKV